MNLWSFILNGIATLLNWVMSPFPMHQNIGIATSVATFASDTIGVMWAVVFANIDMTLPMYTIGVIMPFEIVRAIYAAWRWVKRIFI